MDARRKLLNEDGDYYIVNHDGVGVGATVGRKGLALRGFADALFARKDIRIAVLDEIGAYRGATTRRSRIARSLFSRYDYVWGLTGTPTPNAPTDAHGLKKLVDPGYVGSFQGLRDRTMYPISAFKWERKEGANEIVKQLLTPAIRWRQEDCFDAPAQTVEQREVGLSAAQKKLLVELKREYSLQLQNGGVISAANEGVLRLKLFQIGGGAVYDEAHRSHGVDAGPRLAVLKEILEEAPKKVLIFSPLTNIIKMVHEWLAKQGIEACLINGETSAKERNVLLSDFQKPDSSGSRVLIAHPGPIARGLDLTAAATIVWFTPTDRTEDYIQANQRINGPTQNRHRHIIQLSATPAEREVYRRLDNNESLQGALLKLVENER
jgi:SNF2 family DNA or RNA helicase